MATFNLQQAPTVAVESVTPGVPLLQIPTVQSVTWKNLGRYVAGAVWEEWETSGPSATPPSGHALIGLSSWIEG